MSFFSRVLNHILNEAVVNGLSNSKVFQRFAIRTNEHLKVAAKQGNVLKERAADFGKSFKKEMAERIKEVEESPAKTR